MPTDYSAVTEAPGTQATPENLRMLYTRYDVAAHASADADVLEVACGAGMGLGFIARKARSVVGTDLTLPLLRRAREHYGARVPLLAADATRLPFVDASFDLVVLYEALYYLPDPAGFARECRRVLRPGGRLLVCTANKLRPGFVKSPHGKSYHDAEELSALLEANGFDRPALHGAFSASPPSLAARATLVGFTAADWMRLVPRSLEGRARVKRLLYGRLDEVPAELAPGAMDAEPLVPYAAEDARRWKVVYALARRADAEPRAAREAPWPRQPLGYRAAKRGLDVAAAALGLLVFSPLLVGLALWVKLDTPGPAFYRGRRVGLRGREFRIWKFRSMVQDADRLGGPTTSDDDPRVTRSGRFIRKYKMDELAQLLNLIVGDMSLVGPRPDVPSEVAKLSPIERAAILGVRPGMTDLASIRYHNEGEIVKGHADPHEAYERLIRPGKIALQMRYAREASFATDVRLIFRTISTLVRTRT